MSIIDPKTDMVYGLSVRELDGQVYCEDGRKVVGWLYCDDCGEAVPVKLNKGAKPYYGCARCNNQHRPQSTTSRKFFEDRMEKIEIKGVTHDNNSQNASKKANQPSETESGGAASAGSSSGKRGAGIRVGMF